MPLFRRRASQDQQNATETDRSAAGVADPSRASTPDSGSHIISRLGSELASVLPEDKRGQLNFSVVDPTAASAELDEICGYKVLDWLVRTWLPRWLPPGDPTRDAVASHLRNLSPIHDTESATSASLLISTFAGYDPAVKDQAASMNAKFLGDIAVQAANQRAAEAIKNSIGEAAATAARSVIPGACEAAKVDDVLIAGRAIAWSIAADNAIDAIVAMATAPDPDIRRIVAKNVSPAAAWKALEPIVDDLQNAAIQLYRELVSGFPR